MECPKCKSSEKIKNGIVRSLQRFHCKQCGNNYTVERKSTAVDESIRRIALMMYLGGLGFNSIGRLLGVSHVTVFNWVKKYGQALKEIKNDQPVEIVEIDEKYIRIGSQKNNVKHGMLLTEKENGTLISYWVHI